MPTQRTHAWARGEPKLALDQELYFLSLNSSQKAWDTALHEADGKRIGLGYNRNRVIVDEEPIDGRLVSFLFVHFILLNVFFPILCRFTNINFQDLDFLYFIPSLYGNNCSKVPRCPSLVSSTEKKNFSEFWSAYITWGTQYIFVQWDL